jgi:hypothetical protein
MNVFARFGLTCAFVLAVGMIGSQEGASSVRSVNELFSAVSFNNGTRSDNTIQLAQAGQFAGLGQAFAVQRPSHETLDLAVRAFGYPVSNTSNLWLTLVGMVLLGIGIRNRCRSE